MAEAEKINRADELEDLERDIIETLEDPHAGALRALEYTVGMIESNKAVTAVIESIGDSDEEDENPEKVIEEMAAVFFKLIKNYSLRVSHKDQNLQMVLSILCGELDFHMILGNRTNFLLSPIVEALDPIDAMIGMQVLEKLKQKLLEEFPNTITSA